VKDQSLYRYLCKLMSPMNKEYSDVLSIIIPTLNEGKTGYLPRILKSYHGLENCEIICVDGGSTDDTLEVIAAAEVRLVKTDIASRAGRLNVGIQAANASMVVLHHPRSILDVAGLVALGNKAEQLSWGAFTHKFNVQHPLLKFTSWYSNHIRGDRRGVYYLDHCLFAQKQLLLDVDMLPDIDIFEDTELCLRLKSTAKATRLPFISETSAVRFQVNGLCRQALTNQYMKWLSYFKRSDTEMNKHYEKGIQLNTEYDSKSK
jgi:glycosyltransferase involved in cell wall biosynthesis